MLSSSLVGHCMETIKLLQKMEACVEIYLYPLSLEEKKFFCCCKREELKGFEQEIRDFLTNQKLV